MNDKNLEKSPKKPPSKDHRKTLKEQKNIIKKTKTIYIKK